MQRGAEETGVVGGDGHGDAGAEEGPDATGHVSDRRERARGDVRGGADVEGDAPAGQSPHQCGILRRAEAVRDPDGPEPAQRGGDGVRAAPLPRVSERRQAKGADAGVDVGVIAGGDGRLVAAEAEPDSPGPGMSLREVEDPVRRRRPPLPDGVVEDVDTATAAFVVGEDRLERVAHALPPETDLLDDGGGDVDLGAADPLAAEAVDEIPGDGRVVRWTGETAADVAVEGQKGPGVPSAGLACAEGPKVGENGARPATGEPDESGRRDAALEVKVELDLRGGPEAGEKAPGGARARHEAPSYGGLPPGVLPRERLWVRAAAFGVDLLVFAGGPLLLSTAVIVVILLYSPDPPATLGLGFFAAQTLFVLLFLLRDTWGASPGKRLFGLRLVREGGRPVGVATSVVRNVPMLVPGWNLIELLSVIRSDDGRRGGDRLAGTTLVES